MSGTLTVGFLDERVELAPGDELTFGRRADLVLDENPYMHRVCGRLVHRQGVWWLQNHGSHLRLELEDLDGAGPAELMPGQQLPVTARRSAVRLAAGPANYELELGVDVALDLGDTDVPVGTATVDFGAVPLSPEQHLLLVALFDSSRRNRGAVEGNAVIAARLGWTAKKFHRKLDAVCDKLHREGVRGLRSEPGSGLNAELRRAVLVRHAVNSGLVGPGDLGLLSAPGSPPTPSCAPPGTG
ncbi:MAG: hypothetical protein FJW94_13920 [Actinobacteria bacterium]|nr:hypothetical protein [Actinomycetota bacterium]MBM3694224.1 hypothetical protein [Actinomycetota bacterium]